VVRYKFFILDVTGRIDRAVERECVSDAAAIAFAEFLPNAHDVEVWRGRELLANVPARTDDFRG
jgi:hypothetical protein